VIPALQIYDESGIREEDASFVATLKHVLHDVSVFFVQLAEGNRLTLYVQCVAAPSAGALEVGDVQAIGVHAEASDALLGKAGEHLGPASVEAQIPNLAHHGPGSAS